MVFVNDGRVEKTTTLPSVPYARSQLAARTIGSPAPTLVENVQRRSTVCFPGSANSCPGICSRWIRQRSRPHDSQSHPNRNRVHNPAIVDTIQNGGGLAGMTCLPLESKMFTSVACDTAEQILYLRFRKTGEVYRYFGLPVTEYQAFLDAESRGRFFLAHIREHFRYEQPRHFISQDGQPNAY